MKLLLHVQKEVENLKELKKTLLLQLQSTSRKQLRLSKSHGQFQYYIQEDNKRIYIRKKNIQQARELAQRDYNQSLIPCLSKKISVLENFTQSYSHADCEKCFTELPLARRELVSPYFVNDLIYAKRWQAQKYPPNKDFPEGNNFTFKNEKVRSKSEVIIANMLNSKGIPYHYEVPVKISKEVTLHPDFFCLNKRTRQEFYWEHCGKMDDPDYSQKLVNRLAIYAQKDIIVGKNLILTMETQKQPLNIKVVEKMIAALLV